jgi:hypothetical protein
MLSQEMVLHCPVCLRERGVLIHYAQRQKHCVVCQFESLEILDLGACAQKPCSPEDVLRDSAASVWLKDALLSSLARDPVDAANDAELLARLLEERCRLVLR